MVKYPSQVYMQELFLKRNWLFGSDGVIICIIKWYSNL